ncbi:MAG TPA: TonB-dependent receptor [Terriglobia bacterium]|nr:TonB-dependent receptor [Terriglobia bacterium]
MAKRFLLAFALGVGLMLAPFLARQAKGQVLYGSLVGTVSDQTGAVVPGAAVTVKNTNTGLTRESNTDASGFYSIANLLEGTYDLSVSKSGFRSYTQTGIGISINNVTRINPSLEVGAVAQAITVEASTAVLQTQTSDVKTSIDATVVNDMPLSRFRNYQTLLNLVPGATPARFQNAEADTPERALSTNINGQQRGANNQRLDGSANILVTLPHHAAYIAPVESIQEVNVSTDDFDAEQGMTGGAAVTVVTKSGTNNFHGSAFGYHNNSATRAFTWDENRVGVNRKPKTIMNFDGGSIGGPIKKDKLFFFGDWEGTFERVNKTRLESVPALDLRGGDLSRFLGAQIPDASGNPIMVPTTEGGSVPLQEGMVFDPFSGNPDGTGRSVFSSSGVLNVIPAARLNGPMTTLLDLVPAPNQPAAGDFNNYFVSGTQKLNRNNYDAKVNWNRNEQHQLWFKYSTMIARFDSAGPRLGAAGGADIGDGGLGGCHTRTQIAGIGQTYTVTPTFLVDATLGWTRFGQQCDPPDELSGVNFGLDVLGIPGTNGPTPLEAGMPAFYSNWSDMGNPEGWNPCRRNDQTYTFNSNASWVKGNHEIRFGFDFIHNLMNHFQPELGEGPRGAFHFDPGVTALNPAALEATVGFQGGTPDFENDQNSLAAILLGVPDVSGKSSQYIKMDSLENIYALYVRDRWRVTSKLTLNLGVRWELYPNRRRSAGLGIESYDPTTNKALIGGRGGVPRDNGVEFSKKLFAPRIGFAYQVTKDTVIRSGYGITYQPHPFGAQALRGWFPLTVVGSFSGINGFAPVTTDPTYVVDGIPNAPLGTAVGIPNILNFNINEQGGVPLPNAAEDGYPRANSLLHRGYIQSWNFIVERKLPGETVVSVGYVGTKTVRDFAFLNINAGQIPGAGLDGQLLYTRFGRTASTREYDGRLGSSYHSLQVSLNRRITGGLLLKGAYTYSHAIDMADYSDWTETIWPSNLAWGRNRASASYDIPHNFELGYVYELPFGGGKKFAKGGGAAQAILGGWQINGIFSAFMGGRDTLTASDASLNMPDNQQTPDQVSPLVYKGCYGPDKGCTMFDTSSFVRVTDVRFGTVGRNTLRRPGVVNMDTSIYRTFKIFEKLDLQFRAEAFNLSNTPHFDRANRNVNSSNFGKVTATDSGGRTFAGGRSREYRFGLRLSF